jgi:glycerol uptake operon antiterminator
MTNVQVLLSRFGAWPCCAAVTSEAAFAAALESPVPVIFVLRSDGLRIGQHVRRAHAAGKALAVHLDLVEGLNADRVGVAWLASAGVDAVISSKGQLMPAIQRDGMVAIHRLLLVRRALLDSGLAAVTRSGSDIVEVLPGAILPDVRDVMPRFAAPVLAGGFITTEEIARGVLAAGATCVTTSTERLWHTKLQ